MTVTECIKSTGHAYYATGLTDMLGREILMCGRCNLPVHRDGYNTIGLLMVEDALILVESKVGRMRVVG